MWGRGANPKSYPQATAMCQARSSVQAIPPARCPLRNSALPGTAPNDQHLRLKMPLSLIHIISIAALRKPVVAAMISYFRLKAAA